MSSEAGWTRRKLFGTSVGAAALALGAHRTVLAAPAIVKGSKLTFWGGLIFSDQANKLLVDEINRWGAANGVNTEVVMINQNETVQKVSAAIASNTMPDALDLNLDLLLVLSRQNVFVPLDDLYATIGKAQGGWLAPVDKASEMKSGDGTRTGIPFGVSGNMLLRRNDLLSKAGFANPPATWEEIVTQAVKLTKPPLYGLGLALSNVGDGDTQVGVLQSYGGRIADDTGEDGRDQVRRDARLSALGQGRLGQEAVPAWRHHLGRGRRQQRLCRRAGGVHRQHRLGRHRRAQRRSRSLQGHALLVAAGRAEGRGLADRAEPARHPEIQQEPGDGEGADRASRARRTS